MGSIRYNIITYIANVGLQGRYKVYSFSERFRLNFNREYDIIHKKPIIKGKTMKTCKKCGQEKNRIEFASNPTNPDGLSSWCKDCLLASPMFDIYTCTECGRDIIMEAFIGQSKCCKSCMPKRRKRYWKAYRAKNPEIIKERNRLAYLSRKAKKLS